MFSTVRKKTNRLRSDRFEANLVLLSQLVPDWGQLLTMAAPRGIKLNQHVFGRVLCHLIKKLKLMRNFYRNLVLLTSSKFLATSTFTGSLSQSSGISSDIR